MLKYVNIIFSILVCISPASAEWTVNAEIGRNKIGIEDHVTLDIVFSGDQLKDILTPAVPQSVDWNVMGPSKSSSSSFQIVGTKMTKSTTESFQFILKPLKKGTLTIPQIEVHANGETRTVGPFEVEVVEGSIVPSRQAQPGRTIRPTPVQRETSTEQNIEDNLFIYTTVDKYQALVGEQITYSQWLCTRYPLGSIYPPSKPTAFPDFWSQEIYRAEKVEFEKKTIDGVQYDAILLYKHALFGLTPGTKKIEPSEMTVSIVRRGGFWGMFTQQQPVKVEGKPIQVEIKPLPQNSPVGFDGLVGDFSITARVAPEKPKSYEAMTYEISISGTGNVHNLKPLDLDFPESFELYDIEDKGNVTKDRGKVAANKTFEYVIMPQNPGEFELPEVSIVYFDLDSRSYKTKTAGPITVNILQGEYTGTEGTRVIVNDRVVRVAEDIRYIAPDCGKLESGNLKVTKLTTPGYLFLFEILAILIALSIKQRKQKLSSDIGYARYTLAFKRSLKELKEASKKIGDNEAFVGDVQDAIHHYLADRLGLPREGVVFNEIRDKLAEKRVDDTTLDWIEELLDKLSFLRFAPGTRESASREILDDARKLIAKVDSSFR